MCDKFKENGAKIIGSNMSQKHFGVDTVVLFSYDTPVAAVIDGVSYRTEKKWSNTTSRHINKWGLHGVVRTVPQSFFDALGRGEDARTLVANLSN